MTSPSDIGRRFSRLVLAAVEDPQTVDRSALLIAADAFLNAAQGGDPVGLTLGRQMAYRTVEWRVLDTPAAYAALCRSVALFHMHVKLNPAIEAN